METTEERPAHIFFRARLTPYRSLSPCGFRRIMIAVCAVSAAVSTGLYLAGAWPVFGFLGLDILLIYLAFRASYGSARVAETIELNERELVVERTDRRGDRKRWRFQPTWLRVELPEPVEPGTGVVLRSHGEAVSIGSFLSPDERRAIADSLSGALRAWRNTGLLPR